MKHTSHGDVLKIFQAAVTTLIACGEDSSVTTRNSEGSSGDGARWRHGRHVGYPNEHFWIDLRRFDQ